MAVEDELLRIFQQTENKGGPASERTLQELKDVFNKKFADPSGPLGKTGEAADDAAEGLEGVTNKAKDAEKGLEDFKDGIDRTVRTIDGLVRSGTRVVSGMANVGNSVTNAANSLDAIPVVGGTLATVFGAVASAAEQVVNSFITATGSGATFSGSILDLARNAGMAGMTMDQFGELVRSNGEGLLGLASTTATGARRFSLLSRTLLNTNEELYALGFSTQSINEGLMNYSRLLRIQGIQQGMTDQELLQGTNNYLKTLDSLAKVTGKQRDAIAEEQAQIAASAQFQAALSGTSKEVRDSFNALITQMPNDELKSLAMDLLATGTISQEQNALLASQFPEFQDAVLVARRAIAENRALSIQERQTVDNALIREGGRVEKSLAGIAGANTDLFPVLNSAVAAQQRQLDALLDAEKAQDTAIKSTDDFNTRLQKSQQQIAQLGNFFQVALAQSGMLPHLMNGFLALSSITANVILPVFRLVGDILGATVIPVLQSFGTIVGAVTGTVSSVANTMTLFKTVLSPVANLIGTVLTPVLAGLATASVVVATAYAAQKIAILAATAVTSVYTAMTTLLTGGLAGMLSGIIGVNVSLLPFVAIGLAVAGAFAYLYTQGYTFSGALDNAKDNLLLFGTYLSDTITFLSRMVRNISEDEAERQYAINEDTRKQIAERKAARREEREKLANERSLNSILKNLAPNYQDLLDLQQKDLDQKEQLLNYNDPVALLTGFAEQQGVADRFEQYGQRSGSEAVETAAAGRGARSSTATPRTPNSTTPANPQPDSNATNTSAGKTTKTRGGVPQSDRNNTQSEAAPVTSAPETVDEFTDVTANMNQNLSAEKLDQLNTLVSQLVGYMRETSRNTKSTSDRLGNASGDMFSGIGA